MKKVLLKALLLSVCTICALSVFAQVGEGYWSYSNPKPFGFDCTSVSYIDDNTGIVVGYNGAIGRTTDGGGTWSYFSYTFLNAGNTVTKPSFQDVQFVSATTVLAVGTGGAMVKSIDGGINWSLVKTPFYNSGTTISTVFFLNENYGAIAGDTMGGLTSIYFTINGGANWTRATNLPEEGRSILKIRFNANGVGYAVGPNNEAYEDGGINMNALVWKFSNGGWENYSVRKTTFFPNVRDKDTTIIPHSWDEFSDTIYTTYEDNISGLNQSAYRGIAIVNDTAVVISAMNNGQIVRINTSTPEGSYLMINNGQVTPPHYRPLGSPIIWNLATNDGITIAGASGSSLIVSTDKGFSFNRSDTAYLDGPARGLEYYGVDITPGNRFVLAGSAGVIADSLALWRRPYIAAKEEASPFFGGGGLSTIQFLDGKKGIGAGGVGALLITNDGGDTWEDRTTPGFSDFDGYTSIAYLSADNLMATTSSGGFYKSSDEGVAFDLLFQEPNGGSFPAMHFANKDTGFIIANVTTFLSEDPWTLYHKIAYYTTDGGFTWDSAVNQFPTTSDYSQAANAYDIKFLDSKIGFIVGDQGSIYKTTDGGHTWSKKTVPNDVTGILQSISIVNANIAYVSGWGGAVLKTIDGGETWEYANNGLPTLYANYGKVLSYDANQVMVFSNADVYTTKDGGQSWTSFYSTVGGLKMISNACFAPMENCSTGVCKKVFVSISSGQILKFDADRVLPVKFSNLTASATAQGNQLFWTSFSQKSVRDFVVEGSGNGTTFTQLSGKITADGLDYQSHTWLHTNAPAGKYYYRVKATEKDGAVFYTNIVSLSSIKAAGWKHQVSNGTLIFNNPQAKAGTVNVQVVNASGQLIAAKNWNQSGGAFNNLLLLPANAHGIHYVKLVNEGTVYSFKILIQ